MGKGLRPVLERWPLLYRVMKRGYGGFRCGSAYMRARILGTPGMEREWARRHLRRGNDWNDMRHTGEEDEWVRGYWDSRDHSHRRYLVDRLSSFSPISSILEIGCNCGPNLYLLAKRFAYAQMVGVDINPVAVQRGNEWLAQQGISNVKLLVGRADELDRFADRSFDVVFTDAVLIYIGPDKITRVIKEMLRVARRALLLVEWHCFEPQRKDPRGFGVYHDGKWKRDYIALLRQSVGEERIRVTKITEDIWPDKNWSELGALIQVITG